VNTYEVCTGDFGTPPAGDYLIINETTVVGKANAKGIGSVISESSSSATPEIAKTSIMTNGTAFVGSGANMAHWSTDGTKTLYAWVLSSGVVQDITVTVTIIKV
jgi:hypothetical protein